MLVRSCRAPNFFCVPDGRGNRSRYRPKGNVSYPKILPIEVETVTDDGASIEAQDGQQARDTIERKQNRPASPGLHSPVSTVLRDKRQTLGHCYRADDGGYPCRDDHSAIRAPLVRIESCAHLPEPDETYQDRRHHVTMSQHQERCRIPRVH